METNNWYIRGVNNCGELVRKELAKRGATMDLNVYNFTDENCVYFVLLGMVFCKYEKFDSGKYIIENWTEVKIEKAEPKPKPQFKPFDKVLVCDGKNCRWGIDLYERYDETDKNYPHVCLTCKYRCCIPYESNEHLVGVVFDPKHIEGYDE